MGEEGFEGLGSEEGAAPRAQPPVGFEPSPLNPSPDGGGRHVIGGGHLGRGEKGRHEIPPFTVPVAAVRRQKEVVITW